MDFQRIILIAALSFTLLMLWNAWQRDYGPQPTTSPAESTTTTPAATTDVPAAPSVAATPGTAELPQAATPSGKRIHVVTDLFDADIDSIGGDLRRVDLLKFPVAVDKPNEPIRLLNDGPGEYFVAQSALLPVGSDQVAPTHTSEFVANASAYQLQPGETTLRVPMAWSDGKGLEVTKIYTFHRDSYVIDVDFQIKNNSDKPWQGAAYRQLQRSDPGTGSSLTNRTYTGAVISTDEKNYSKVSFKDMEKEQLSIDTQQGWVAMMQHYFLGAWIPATEGKHHIYSKPLGDNRYMIGMYDPTVTVEPGKEVVIPAKLYVGPKHTDVLAGVAPNLERTVDYGWLTLLAKPLFLALKFIHGLVQNWGWSIIILTILIKLAFYKLSAASYKSMAHMRQVQPKMAALKERYGDDKQKYQEAMMKLYREEKINPLGGCLPILVQIPVFIALYYMLLESVEMRQAPFILWIKDLSIADPYYVLPILMGVTMLIQHRLNPTPLDPIQARVMMVLPIVFTFFFIFFPAGLVVYWVVNNTLSIAQQWYITRAMTKKA
ncbi:MAG TPA: membrane protein insertase YidC [Gammaproteobacteria bacterium]